MSKPYTLTISDGEHSTFIRLSAEGLDHLLSCAEIGAEGDTDDADDRTEASFEVEEALSELRLFEKLSDDEGTDTSGLSQEEQEAYGLYEASGRRTLAHGDVGN